MTSDSQIDIGQVVHRSGVPVSTLHVWERHGLVTPSGRRGLRRQYDGNILERIAFIVLFQRGGFSLAEIADLLNTDLSTNGKQQMTRKLSQLRHRQDELTAAITGLEHALSCPEPSLMECPTFRLMLDNALPIEHS